MKTLKFGGYSDDTFGEITPRGQDYDNCASGKPVEWLIESASENQSLLIVGQYCPGAAQGWLVGIAPANDSDDKPIPQWATRLRRPVNDGEGRPYSPVLEIDVPDDATLRCLQADEDE